MDYFDSKRYKIEKSKLFHRVAHFAKICPIVTLDDFAKNYFRFTFLILIVISANFAQC